MPITIRNAKGTHLVHLTDVYGATHFYLLHTPLGLGDMSVINLGDFTEKSKDKLVLQGM